MQRLVKGYVVALLAGVAAGCTQSGLSAHEGGQQSYPMLMYTAAESFAEQGGPVSIRLPARVALAQVGEVAPPQDMVDALRARPTLFRRVVPVTGVFNAAAADEPARPCEADGSTAAAHGSQRDQLARMRSMAAALGMDYLLVFGGAIDHGEQGSGLQLLDLTIVGAFVVPSHGVSVNGRAAGSLFDVRTGRVVMDFSAQAKGSGTAPTAFVANVETVSVQKNRDELVQRLTSDIIQQVSAEAKEDAAK